MQTSFVSSILESYPTTLMDPDCYGSITSHLLNLTASYLPVSTLPDSAFYNFGVCK
jgi:hypothetical protein